MNVSEGSPSLEITSGDWAGWSLTEGDPFNAHVGPFYHKGEGETLVCAMRVAPHHLNGGGSLHGGALATFADWSLFVFAGLTGDSDAVTIGLNCDYVGAAPLGGQLSCRGEVIRETGSMIFLRGLITCEESPIMAFSGVLKKIRRSNPQALAL